MKEQPEYRDPRLAAVLSLLYSGLGQIYNGQVAKGIVLIIISALALVAVIVGLVGLFAYTVAQIGIGLVASIGFMAIGLAVIIGLGIFSTIDARKAADEINRSLK